MPIRLRFLGLAVPLQIVQQEKAHRLDAHGDAGIIGQKSRSVMTARISSRVLPFPDDSRNPGIRFAK